MFPLILHAILCFIHSAWNDTKMQTNPEKARSKVKLKEERSQ